MNSIQICLDVHFTAVFRNVFLHHLVYTLFLLIRITLLYSPSMSERIDTNSVICLRRPIEWSFKTTQNNRKHYGFLYFSFCIFTLKAGRQKCKGKFFLILSTVPWRRKGRWRYSCTIPWSWSSRFTPGKRNYNKIKFIGRGCGQTQHLLNNRQLHWPKEKASMWY